MLSYDSSYDSLYMQIALPLKATMNRHLDSEENLMQSASASAKPKTEASLNSVVTARLGSARLGLHRLIQKQTSQAKPSRKQRLASGLAIFSRCLMTLFVHGCGMGSVTDVVKKIQLLSSSTPFLSKHGTSSTTIGSAYTTL